MLWEKELLSQMVRLQTDKIINVRIELSALLARNYLHIMHLPEIQ